MELPQESKQLRNKVESLSKKTLTRVLLLACLVLLILPFWVSFQDILTRGVLRVGWYKAIQDTIVPYELRVVGSLLLVLGFPVRMGAAYVEWTKPSGGNEVIYLIWNCVGWQTLILFVITLITGLSGKHTWMSKLEALLIGIMGTYLINILRLIAVIVVYFWVGRTIGQVFHDYFSNLFSSSWLIGFWWFSYRFVLDPTSSD